MLSKVALRGGPAQGCPYLVVVRSGEEEVVEGAALVGIITAVVAEVTMGLVVEWPDHQAQQLTPCSPNIDYHWCTCKDGGFKTIVTV